MRAVSCPTLGAFRTGADRALDKSYSSRSKALSVSRRSSSEHCRRKPGAGHPAGRRTSRALADLAARLPVSVLAAPLSAPPFAGWANPEPLDATLPSWPGTAVTHLEKGSAKRSGEIFSTTGTLLLTSSAPISLWWLGHESTQSGQQCRHACMALKERAGAPTTPPAIPAGPLPPAGPASHLPPWRLPGGSSTRRPGPASKTHQVHRSGRASVLLR